jgi:tRNA threonylcarbamoyladenosine biosynthesis protein TsaB
MSVLNELARLQVIREENKLVGYWLALDTSTAALTIALLKDGQVIGERSTEADRNHSIRLLPDIQELLARFGQKAAGLNGIAVGRGPGSYTGIRMAVTAAKTLAWTLKLPLIGISSLEALAYGAAIRAIGAEEASGADEASRIDGLSGVIDGSSRVWIVPYMDARRGKAYTGLYEWRSGKWSMLEADSIRMLEDWEVLVQEMAEQVEGARVDRIIFAGQPIGHGGQRVIAKTQLLDEELLRAAYVGRLAARYGMDMAVRDIHSFEPNYTQLSEPEKFIPAKP